MQSYFTQLKSMFHIYLNVLVQDKLCYQGIPQHVVQRSGNLDSGFAASGTRC